MFISNNIGIGFRAFAGGIALGLGSIYFMALNGLQIGAVATHLAQSFGAIVSISRFNPISDTVTTYAGLSSGNDFPVVPGEAYLIRTSEDVAYVPSHF